MLAISSKPRASTSFSSSLSTSSSSPSSSSSSSSSSAFSLSSSLSSALLTILRNSPLAHVTCPWITMPSARQQQRAPLSPPAPYGRRREARYSDHEKQTIYQRRLERRVSGSASPPLPLLALHGYDDVFRQPRVAAVAAPVAAVAPVVEVVEVGVEEVEADGTWESDAQCWARMLALQRRYHCYNSARLEAAVEALESGTPIGEVPMPSRLCLDLLNEGLKAQLAAQGDGSLVSV